MTTPAILPIEFISFRDTFLKHLSTAKTLHEYKAPVEARKKQLEDAGHAAASTSAYLNPCLCCSFTSRQINLLGYVSQLLNRDYVDMEELREGIFTIRGFYHELYAVDGKKAAYPPSYDGVRQLTHYIQEERLARKAAAAKKKAPKSKVLVADSDDEGAGAADTPGTDPSVIASTSTDQMQVDDDAKAQPSLPNFKKIKVAAPHSCLPHDSIQCAFQLAPSATISKSKKSDRKRRREEFDENAFIAEAIKNLTAGPTANFIVEEARHIMSQPSDLHSTVPAIKKRLYQLMIEVAVINEKIRSELAIRAEHIEDAADLTARLNELAPSTNDGNYSA
ncbi:hypothetical protein FB451DRAFT_1191191 [Mycena latifolia]|nr:hypothetical protein FB451DRAFT_1191191 [Mycena latifolia]